MSKLPLFIRKFVPKGKIARAATILSSATALGQVFIILASPILTRLYTPEDFGLLAAYAAILSITSVVASLRYDVAIPLPGRTKIAANLLVLSIILALFSSVMIGLILWVFGYQIVAFLNLLQLHPYLWLIPVGVLAVGGYQALNYWAIRKKDFSNIAYTKLSQSISSVVVQVTLGLCKVGPIGLITGQVVGQAAGAGILAASALKNSRKNFSGISLRSIWLVAIKYRRFPIISSGSALLNRASLQFPVLLIASFYGSYTLGLFALAQRILNIPLATISSSVSQVYFSSAAELVKKRDNSLIVLFHKITRRLFLFSLIPTIIFSIIAPDLFSLIFGEQWYEAGVYASILAPVYMAQFVVSSVSQTFIATDHLSYQLVWDAIRLLVVFCALFFSTAFESPEITIVIYSTTLVLLYIALYFVYIKVIRQMRQ